MPLTEDEFRGALPFDLWDRVPPSLAAVLPSVMWSRARLHQLVLPVVEVPLRDLRWQLDLPWWRVDGTAPPSSGADGRGAATVERRYFAVSPNEVRRDPRTHGRHWQRTLDADPRFPIHLLQRDRLIILDGVHRLLQAEVHGREHVSAHVVDHALFVARIVERGSPR